MVGIGEALAKMLQGRSYRDSEVASDIAAGHVARNPEPPVEMLLSAIMLGI